MSTQDKTGDKLAESIRMAKTDTSSVKKSVVKKKPVTKKKTPAVNESTAVPEASSHFQSGRRVWPD